MLAFAVHRGDPTDHRDRANLPTYVGTISG